MELYIFFKASPRKTWLVVLACARFGPLRLWDEFRLRWVQSWGGSDLEHVAVGDGEVVLDPNAKGNRYWPQESFAAHYPGLVSVFEVPAAVDVDLSWWEGCGRKPWWSSAWKAVVGRRWVTGRDCVDTVCGVLYSGGVCVPSEVWSPAKLRDWLWARYPGVVLS